MMGSFHNTKKTPVFTVKPSDENLHRHRTTTLYSARRECGILLYSSERRHRKWVIILANTDTTEKFLCHKGWSILR